jgi:hypothetical protein
VTKNRQQIVSSRRSPVARVTGFLLIIECIVLGIFRYCVDCYDKNSDDFLFFLFSDQ